MWKFKLYKKARTAYYILEIELESDSRITPVIENQIQQENVMEETEIENQQVSKHHEGETPGTLTSPSEENQLSEYQLARDRQRRVIRPPARIDQAGLVLDQVEIPVYALNCDDEDMLNESLTYNEAIISENKEKWMQAMNIEMASLYKNNKWELIQLPIGHKVVDCKWIYKLKPSVSGEKEPRFKARLVAKEYNQKYGVDYNEVFSPVARHSSIRTLLSLVAHYDLELEQMDVTTTFLHGELDEEIYMRQPQGFEEKGNDTWCVN